MFKSIVFFALLAFALAAPKPDPLAPLLYTAGTPLTYTYPGASQISYSNLGLSSGLSYGYTPYAAGYPGYYYGGVPLAYRNLYV